MNTLRSEWFVLSALKTPAVLIVLEAQIHSSIQRSPLGSETRRSLVGNQVRVASNARPVSLALSPRENPSILAGCHCENSLSTAAVAQSQFPILFGILWSFSAGLSTCELSVSLLYTTLPPSQLLSRRELLSPFATVVNEETAKRTFIVILNVFFHGRPGFMALPLLPLCDLCEVPVGSLLVFPHTRVLVGVARTNWRGWIRTIDCFPFNN